MPSRAAVSYAEGETDPATDDACRCRCAEHQAAPPTHLRCALSVRGRPHCGAGPRYPAGAYPRHRRHAGDAATPSSPVAAGPRVVGNIFLSRSAAGNRGGVAVFEAGDACSGLEPVHRRRNSLPNGPPDLPASPLAGQEMSPARAVPRLGFLPRRAMAVPESSRGTVAVGEEVADPIAAAASVHHAGTIALAPIRPAPGRRVTQSCSSPPAQGYR